MVGCGWQSHQKCASFGVTGGTIWAGARLGTHLGQGSQHCKADLNGIGGQQCVAPYCPISSHGLQVLGRLQAALGPSCVAPNIGQQLCGLLSTPVLCSCHAGRWDTLNVGYLDSNVSGSD